VIWFNFKTVIPNPTNLLSFYTQKTSKCIQKYSLFFCCWFFWLVCSFILDSKL